MIQNGATNEKQNEGTQVIGNLPRTKRWSIKEGDYIRSYEKHHLDIKEVRRKEKVKRRVITAVVLTIAFIIEFFILHVVAKM